LVLHDDNIHTIEQVVEIINTVSEIIARYS